MALRHGPSSTSPVKTGRVRKDDMWFNLVMRVNSVREKDGNVGGGGEDFWYFKCVKILTLASGGVRCLAIFRFENIVYNFGYFI